MLQRKNLVLMMCVFSILFASCSMKHWAVGKEIDPEYWAEFSSGERVVMEDNIFLYDMTITKTENDREYALRGTINGSNGSLKSIGRLVAQDTRLTLLLAKDGVVIDSVVIVPLGNDLLQNLPIDTNFQSDDFDHFSIIGRVSARG